MHVVLLLLLLPHVVWGAVTATSLTTGADSTCTTGSAPAPASITINADELVLACVENRIGSGTAGFMSISGPGGLTWVEIHEIPSGAGTSRLKLFRAMSATPLSGAPTLSMDVSQTSCHWGISQFAGVDTTGTSGSGAVVQAKEQVFSGTQTATMTLDAALSVATNAAYGCTANAANQALVAGTTPPFTEIGTQVGAAVAGRAMPEIGTTASNQIHVTSPGSNTAILVIGLELKDASGTLPVSGRRRRPPQHQSLWLLDYFLARFSVPAYPGGAYVAG